MGSWRCLVRSDPIWIETFPVSNCLLPNCFVYLMDELELSVYNERESGVGVMARRLGRLHIYHVTHIIYFYFYFVFGHGMEWHGLSGWEWEWEFWRFCTRMGLRSNLKFVCYMGWVGRAMLG